MRILVTGGAGFIGSHLADRLVSAGHRVAVLDDLSSGRLAHLEQSAGDLRFFRGSILDRELVRDLLVAADRVVHLAAVVGVERVAVDPRLTWQVIVEGSRILLELAAARGLPVLLVSSSEVYGFEPPVPVRESDIATEIAGDAPRLSYARAKLYADGMARRRARQDCKVLVVRPFNVVGPRQSESGGAVLPRFVEDARHDRPLHVHGDGQQRRTFLDVRDLAEMLAQLVQQERFEFDAVNVGGERELSVLQLARRVVQVLGSRSRIRRVAPPEARGGVEVQRRVPDLTRLGRLVTAPEQRPIEDSIRALVEDDLQLLGTA